MNVACFRKPSGRWSFADYAGLFVLLAAALILFLPGISLRSLWGSEGRWAVIAREMMQTGNYFLPTINGQVYFDKPLLSYWAIIPFSWFTGVTETTARLPGALSGIATVGITYALGRRLFGRETGFLAGVILLTTAMFGFWSRTASAELLNVLAIWLMLWMLSGDRKPSFGRYLAFYFVAAVSSFCKGPVAPAVALVTASALSLTETAVDMRDSGPDARGGLARHFDWILSLKGSFAALCGLGVFALLLFLPVIITGSWNAVELMWRENVTRFFKPFDHVEPFYSYFKHIPVFLLPWSFVAAAALISIRKWEAGRSRRWLICVTVAIFMFFTLSGSRRSYYILPIVPALALIVGRSLAGFLYGAHERDSVVMKGALIITGLLPVLAGAAMIAAYFWFEQYSHISEAILGPVVMAAGAYALLLLCRQKFIPGIVVTILAVSCVLSWGYTAGSAIGERQRTLKPFAVQLRGYFERVDRPKIAMYGMGNSSLIFYLDMPGPLKSIDDEAGVCAHVRKPGSYLLTQESLADRMVDACGPGSVVRLLTQPGEGNKRDREGIVLIRSGNGM
jgi:4-amino-4-deoxy-L-arabinose transferase-like glycosyltransferase